MKNLKNLKNLGNILNKKQQREINGGFGPSLACIGPSCGPNRCPSGMLCAYPLGAPLGSSGCCVDGSAVNPFGG